MRQQGSNGSLPDNVQHKKIKEIKRERIVPQLRTTKLRKNPSPGSNMSSNIISRASASCYTDQIIVELRPPD